MNLLIIKDSNLRLKIIIQIKKTNIYNSKMIKNNNYNNKLIKHHSNKEVF